MKPLQGYLDFLLIRASRGPFRLKHKTQGPSHIHIPKGVCWEGESSGEEKGRGMARTRWKVSKGNMEVVLLISQHPE